MDAPKTQTVVLQNVIFPFALQSFLTEICSNALLVLMQSIVIAKGSCGTALCMTNSLRHDKPRQWGFFQPSTIDSMSFDTEEDNLLEKCIGSILDNRAAPEVKCRISKDYFAEWLLVSKNKDDEEKDEDEEDEDDVEGDDEDDEGDDDEGDDDEGGKGEGEEGEGDDDEDDDDDDDEEDDDEEDYEDEEDEDEVPPKKLKK